MTWFHGGQIALAAFGVFVAVRHLRPLLFDNALLPKPFLLAIERQIGNTPAATMLADAARPAWIAQAASVGLAERNGQAPPGALEELAFDLGQAATGGIRTLRTIGRASSPLAFIGVIVELGLAFHGEHGLLALQRGFVEQRAMQHAIVGLTIGLVSSVCAFVAAATLYRHGRAQLRALQQVCALFESAEAMACESGTAPAPLSRAET